MFNFMCDYKSDTPPPSDNETWTIAGLDMVDIF